MEVRKTDANETGVVEHLPVYSDWLNGIASRYRQSQIKAAISVNAEMLKFYWSLGADIIRMEKDQPWGSKFMQRLSTDLKVSMPDASCFSRVNLYYMVRFFKLYVPPKIVQQVAEQLLLTEFVKGYPKVSELIFSVPWRHHMVIIDKFETVGLVICREKDRVTVQYALESSSLPIGVSDYVLERFIPADFKSQLPTVEEVEGELTRRMEIAERHLGGMLADGTGVGLAVGER